MHTQWLTTTAPYNPNMHLPMEYTSPPTLPWQGESSDLVEEDQTLCHPWPTAAASVSSLEPCAPPPQTSVPPLAAMATPAGPWWWCKRKARSRSLLPRTSPPTSARCLDVPSIFPLADLKDTMSSNHMCVYINSLVNHVYISRYSECLH